MCVEGGEGGVCVCRKRGGGSMCVEGGGGGGVRERRKPGKEKVYACVQKG